MDQNIWNFKTVYVFVDLGKRYATTLKSLQSALIYSRTDAKAIPHSIETRVQEAVRYPGWCLPEHTMPTYPPLRAHKIRSANFVRRLFLVSSDPSSRSNSHQRECDEPNRKPDKWEHINGPAFAAFNISASGLVVLDPFFVQYP